MYVFNIVGEISNVPLAISDNILNPYTANMYFARCLNVTN